MIHVYAWLKLGRKRTNSGSEAEERPLLAQPRAAPRAAMGRAS